MRIIDAARNTYCYIKDIHTRQHIIHIESGNMNYLSLEELTKEEYNAVTNRWKGISNLRILPKYYRMFKTLDHFDPDFVSDDLFMPHILRKLNKRSESEAFVHKGLYDVLFKDSISRPKTLVNNINGVFYTSTMEPVSFDRAISILKGENAFIIKPTLGTCMGKDVKRIVTKEEDLSSLLLHYKQNYITQQVVSQSSFTSVFNPASLNTFRISTLNLNGRVSVCSVLFRCGQSDSIIDNGGAGGIMVGVDENGSFRAFGYNNKYQKFYETRNGTLFAGKHINNFSYVLERIKNIHQIILPTIGYAGWDVAIDEHDEPLMIEVNLVWPGIQFEQLCPGIPIFGERTDEVIHYLLNYSD